MEKKEKEKETKTQVQKRTHKLNTQSRSLKKTKVKKSRRRPFELDCVRTLVTLKVKANVKNGCDVVPFSLSHLLYPLQRACATDYIPLVASLSFIILRLVCPCRSSRSTQM